MQARPVIQNKISYIGAASIEIEKAGGRIFRLTLPEGCSVPEEFKVGDEVRTMIYPRLPPFVEVSYWEIWHAPSGKIIKAFYNCWYLRSGSALGREEQP